MDQILLQKRKGIEVEKETERKIPVAELAAQLGVALPANSLLVVVEDESPTAVREYELVNPDSRFMTDQVGNVLTVQQMMGG